ncbi:T9SS type A sorting domain-containing protein [uncultured Winogradskyella sp.]|uniref:T9SS type A sorting domain-containing protein n=1 Tax=uncultured Winogradskyella sp. TaxID=395353 RepID=UPI002612A609|nr:T9SS type A sorting domain-containing protein [uncultured Winogradskyella sp.]
MILLISFKTSFSQSKTIFIDGVFDDWTSDLQTYTDTAESINGIDLLEFQVTNDDNFLYLRIKANSEFDLTGGTPILHDLFLYLDTDLDVSTGFAVRDDFGAELGIDLADRILYNNFNGTSSPNIFFSDITFRSAPTVTSDEFEIAIRRDAIPDGVNALFPINQVKILFRNVDNFDWLPNLNNIYTYTFSSNPTSPYVPIDLSKSNSSYIRIMGYNTKLNGLLDNDKLDEYERILNAINPDIVGFVESSGTSESYIKSLFDTWLPLGNPNGWYVEKHGGEVTVSRWEITQQWDLERQFPVLIDLPSSYQTDLLFTNAHLTCCGNDEARQRQVDEYAAFILDAKTSGGIITLLEDTPIVYSGDLNLVGLSQQLTTLVTGDIQDTATYGNGAPLDWDDSDMKDENVLQSDIPMNYTWRNDFSAFPPGKLDYMIFSDAVLQAEKSYTLQTEVMSMSRLSEYNLLISDTSTASDHLPVIVDFSIPQSLSTTSNEEDLLTFSNPVKNRLKINFKSQEIFKLSIYNLSGSLIKLETKSKYDNEIDVSDLTSGVYLLTAESKFDKAQSFKIIKL